MIKFLVKIGFLSAVIVLLFFSGHYVQAATACSSNSVSNAKPFWGSNSSQTVTADKGSQVAITFEGEDGCAGMIARFGVYTVNNPNTESVVTVTLGLGSAVPNKPGIFFLNGNWTINLDPGTYGLTIKKVGNNLFGGVGISPNQLIVRANQSCNISKVYATPSGGRPGESAQLTVESTGSCQGWKASLNVVNIDPGTPASRLTPFQGTQQDISSGKAVWSWTFPAVSNGRQGDHFQLSANLGSQTDIRSATFCVGDCSAVGGGAGGGCGTPGQPVCAPGSEQNYSFEIPNPFFGGADNFTDLVKIIAQWIFNLAIPIAVAMIVYAGILFLTAAGEPAKVTKAKDVLKYAVIGLAIIMIGSGFVTLIQSVLELGGTGEQTEEGPPEPGPVYGPPAPGVVGNKCSGDRDCLTGLKCQDTICKRATGNWVNEPCNSTRNCDVGLTCDRNNPQPPIDGQNLGLCIQAVGTGGNIGASCQSDNQCISGLKCNQICQRRDGNLNGEVCLSTSNPSNCQSRACHTVSPEVRGDCVPYSGT